MAVTHNTDTVPTVTPITIGSQNASFKDGVFVIGVYITGFPLVVLVCDVDGGCGIVICRLPAADVVDFTEFECVKTLTGLVDDTVCWFDEVVNVTLNEGV